MRLAELATNTYMTKRTKLRVGEQLYVFKPLRPGLVEVVHVIGVGETPNSNDVFKWYGQDAPDEAFRAIDRERYVVRRVSIHNGKLNGYIIFPDTSMARTSWRRT